MPFYEYRCINPMCKTDKYTEFQKMDEVHESFSPDCGEKANRIYGLGTFIIDFKPGYDAGLGEYVNTAKQRDEIMKTHGLRRKT